MTKSLTINFPDEKCRELFWQYEEFVVQAMKCDIAEDRTDIKRYLIEDSNGGITYQAPDIFGGIEFQRQGVSKIIFNR